MWQEELSQLQPQALKLTQQQAFLASLQANPNLVSWLRALTCTWDSEQYHVPWI